MRGVDGAELATGLDLIDRKREGRAAPMACCPRCSEPTPLISTIMFYKAEFYCLECGGRFGFLSPRPVEATPELDGRHKALQAEWDEHTKGLIVEGRSAADEAAQRAHDEAVAWLGERAAR